MRGEGCGGATGARYIHAVREEADRLLGLGRQETAHLMTDRRSPDLPHGGSPQRTPNRRLAALIAEAGFSNAGLARRVDQLGLEHGLDLRYDKTSVTRWLRGQQPRGTTPALI